MHTFYQIFGEGKNLNALQMSSRSVVIFLVALILIRLSGRRSFGVRTPLDIFIVICLGAVLSRAIVGASEFIPVVVASFVIVCLHRLFGWLIALSKSFSQVMAGKKILLFADGKFIPENLRKGLVGEEDVMPGVRKSALTEDLQQIDKVYLERNGEVSAIKKKP
jgi:uncharacterized membrane protein YcaP (DUF421 family)